MVRGFERPRQNIMSVTLSELAYTGRVVSGELVVVFDRNLWNPEAIHCAINYIERNPAPANLAAALEAWSWSSA